MTFRQKWQTFANSGHTGAIADREKGGRAKRLWDVGVRGGVGTRCGENNVNRKKSSFGHEYLKVKWVDHPEMKSPFQTLSKSYFLLTSLIPGKHHSFFPFYLLNTSQTKEGPYAYLIAPVAYPF